MGLQKCSLNINRNLKELQPHGTSEFPCAGYSKKYVKKTEDIIPWHWHEDIEIVYIKDGSLRLKIQANSFFLEKGDCFVINSNVIHYAEASPICDLQSLVFSPLLITGNDDSVFAKKYILPLVSCTSFNGYLLKADDDIPTTRYFTNAFEALAHDVSGYEFIIRQNLSSICFLLYSQYEMDITTDDIGLNYDNLRMRKMLEFINHNFSENISLIDVAKVAGIGERECLRCFKRIMQLSPMQYLLKYRVMQGADLLLRNPTNSISEIASQCGFDSPSNFSKMFKRYYNCAPRDYRNMT